jgi:hypothetical protein
VTYVSYLLLDVVKRIGRVDGEADQDNVRVGVWERAETVVILLTGGIPEGELHVFTIDLDVGDIILENGGDVDLCAIVSACALQCVVVRVVTAAMRMRTS